MLQDLTAARYMSHKADLLQQINGKLDQLRVLLRMCHDLHYLDHDGYRFAAKQIDEAGKMLGGWQKQQATKGA